MGRGANYSTKGHGKQSKLACSARMSNRDDKSSDDSEDSNDSSVMGVILAFLYDRRHKCRKKK